MDLSDRALYELDGVGPLSIEVVEFLTNLVLAHQERLPGHLRKVLTPARDRLIQRLYQQYRTEDPGASVSQIVTRIVERVRQVERHPPKSLDDLINSDTPTFLWLIRSAAPVPNHRRIRQILEQEGVQ